MKRTAFPTYLPEIILTLGAIAVAIGTAMAFHRDRQRQLACMDPLADTAEVDATPDDIAAANDLLEEPVEPLDGTDPPPVVAVLDTRVEDDVTEVRIEAVPNGLVVHLQDPVARDAHVTAAVR